MREMQSQVTVRCYYILYQAGKILKNLAVPSVDEEVE